MESPRPITPPSRTPHNMPHRPQSSLRSPGRIASIWSQGVHTPLTSRRAPPIWSCWPICRLFTFIPLAGASLERGKDFARAARPLISRGFQLGCVSSDVFSVMHALKVDS